MMSPTRHAWLGRAALRIAGREGSTIGVVELNAALRRATSYAGGRLSLDALVTRRLVRPEQTTFSGMNIGRVIDALGARIGARIPREREREREPARGPQADPAPETALDARERAPETALDVRERAAMAALTGGETNLGMTSTGAPCPSARRRPVTSQQRAR